MIPENKYDIGIECGADFAQKFVIRDDGGSLVDLTGASVFAQLREYAEAQDYLQFTATHNSAGGVITITMPHEDTAQIGYTSGVYDLFLTLDGVTDKIFYGDVVVYPAVTKPVNGEIMYLLSFNAEENFPTVGMLRRVYFSHASGKMYRWNGTNYVSVNMKTYWDDIPDKPETFPPSEHDHDDRYYTETEMDTALAGKSDVGHDHDDRYYTEAETDDLLSGKSDVGHTHDDRYYTEAETDTLLSGKSDTDHTHDDRYYTEGEVDTLLSAKADTDDLGALATKDTVDYDTDIDNLPTLGALAEKDAVDWDTDIDDIPSTFPPSSHTHTTSDISNFPTLGSLAAKSSVDYSTSEVTNKPTLGTMSSVNDAPSDGKEYARKNGGWSEVTGGGGGGSAEWGDITGTLSDQTDLKNALDAKVNTADLGDLASKDSVDYLTEVTNKPTLGTLAGKNSVDYSTNEITNKPTLGALAAKSSVDYSTSEVTNKPTLGTMSSVNDASSDSKLYGRKNGAWSEVPTPSAPEWGDIGGTLADQTDLANALAAKANTADLGTLASQNKVDWDTDIDDIPSTFPPSSHTHTTSDISNFPTLGSLAAKSSVDYSSSEVTNKPTLGTMAAINDAPSDGDEYVRKNGAWAIASGGGGGSSAWGSITGTLADQTDLKNALDGKVSTSGDTMTGGLLITKAHPVEMTLRNTSMNTAQSLSQYYSNLRFEDVNGKLAGFVQCLQEGDHGQIQLSARRLVSGTNKTATLVIRIKDNGTEQVEVSSASAWCTALGLSSLATATSSGLKSYTNSSKFSGTIKYIKFGNLCQLFLNGISLLADVDDSSWFNIGTIPSGYRPNMQIHQIFLGSDSADFGRFYIDSTGSMNVKAAYGGTITAGTSYYFTVTYIIY